MHCHENSHPRRCSATYLGAKQCTIVIYVDDILISCEHKGAITWLRDKLRSIYGGVSFHYGAILSYLGQTFDFASPTSSAQKSYISAELLVVEKSQAASPFNTAYRASQEIKFPPDRS